jgi:predicted ATPase/tRNA A-37 threonylcarbamoyl transferase component Bud32
LVSQTISHYRILKKLGAGGMGEVYLAEDTKLERKVALKILPERHTKDETRLRRFVLEAKTASALNHPNIITIYDVGEDISGRFIAMEFVEGRTLRTMINADFSPELLIPVGKQVAAALAVAHKAAILHRDIKPENIMLREDGYVKVLDFGLARLNATETDTELSADTTFHTLPGTIVGTPAYMSPEQAKGQSLTGATDIFSLGAVFYEVITGQKPFRAPTAVGILHAIIYEQPLPPSHLNPDLLPSIELLVLRMLDKNPLSRPAAGEIVAALTTGSETISLSSNILSMPFASASAAYRRTVGREQEREKMRRTFQLASIGSGRMLCIAGEAGLGKTTLVEDFLAEVLRENSLCQVARGRSSERLAGAEAYLPFLEALESLLRSTSGQAVTNAMKSLAPSWYIQLTSSQDSSIERAMTESPAVSQERMKRELVAFLQEISRDNPLVLFFDDLHWAGTSTIDIITYLAGKLAAMRVLMITTYRLSEMVLNKHPFLSLKLDLQGRGVSQELQLEFLTREDVEHYLALEFPGHRFPKELAALIYAKTEGSPLFMADVTRYLRDKKVIGEDEGHWALVQSVPEIENDLPETVRSMIQRKIAQLSDEDRRLLTGASAQGYKFDSAVIAKAMAIDAGEVEDRLQALDQTYGFVKYLKEEELPDHTLTLRYRFVHVLYQNGLYASLTPSRRASLSAAIAQAILDYHGKQSPAVGSELALLFQAARNWSQASNYYLIAARNAARVFANQEAIALCRRGLEVTGKLPESGEQAQQELRFQLTMGQSLMTVQGYAASDTLQTYLRAHELCQQLGDDKQLFRVQFGLSIVYVVRAEYDKARHFAEQCLEVAERIADSSLLVQAHWGLALSLQYLGEFLTALKHLELSISLYDHKLHATHVLLYGAILNHAHCGRALLYLGYADKAQAAMQQALTVAEKSRHPIAICNVFTIAFSIELLHQNHEKVREMAERMLVYADEHVLPYYAGIGRIMQGWALAVQGENEAGIACMRKGIAELRAAEIEQQRTNYLGLLAEALCRAGRREEGLQVIDEALQTIEDTGERFSEAELYRIKGELLLSRSIADTHPSIVDDKTICILQTTSEIPLIPKPEPQMPVNELVRAEAEACFYKAIEIANTQSAKTFELRASISLASLWLKEGRQAEAQEMLLPLFNWFTEGFETSDLKIARALLDELP